MSQPGSSVMSRCGTTGMHQVPGPEVTRVPSRAPERGPPGTGSRRWNNPVGARVLLWKSRANALGLRRMPKFQPCRLETLRNSTQVRPPVYVSVVIFLSAYSDRSTGPAVNRRGHGEPALARRPMHPRLGRLPWPWPPGRARAIAVTVQRSAQEPGTVWAAAGITPRPRGKGQSASEPTDLYGAPQAF